MTARWPLVLNGSTIQELQSSDTLNGVQVFASGTAMLFVQTAAPTGWTKQTTYNDRALRVVSGAAGSGGSYTFSSTFVNGSAGATTLSTAQMPSHTHGIEGTKSVNAYLGSGSVGNSGTVLSSATGGGDSHTHSLSLAVAYVDVIIATKD